MRGRQGILLPIREVPLPLGRATSPPQIKKIITRHFASRGSGMEGESRMFLSPTA